MQPIYIFVLPLQDMSRFGIGNELEKRFLNKLND